TTPALTCLLLLLLLLLHLMSRLHVFFCFFFAITLLTDNQISERLANSSEKKKYHPLHIFLLVVITHTQFLSFSSLLFYFKSSFLLVLCCLSFHQLSEIFL